MGIPQRLGTIPLAIFTDASNNIGIGGSPSGSYKFEVTGASRFWDGTQGLNVRAYTGGAGFGAIYSTGVTPGAGNFALAASSTATILSGVDNVSMAINSATKLYINNAGNVGINTTSPAQILQTETATGTNNIHLFSLSGATRGFIGVAGIANSILNEAAVGDVVIRSQLGKILLGTFQSGGSDAFAALTIANNRNVGIGTSSPNYLLDVNGIASSTTEFRLNASFTRVATKDSGGGFGGGYNFNWNNGSPIHDSTGSLSGYGYASDGSIRFYTNGSASANTSAPQRVSILSGGEVLMNTTSVLTSGWLCIAVPSNNYNAIVLKDTGTTYSSGNYYQLFTNSNNSIAGSVSHPTSGTTSFNTSSDYRLKEDFKDFDGTSVLSNLKFYDFKWKEDNVRMYGVKAHEVDEFVPLAVSGTKDAVDENGNIIAQGVDYSKLVPVIGKALQEAIAKIEQLEAKVSALENKS